MRLSKRTKQEVILLFSTMNTPHDNEPKAPCLQRGEHYMYELQYLLPTETDLRTRNANAVMLAAMSTAEDRLPKAKPASLRGEGFA